MQIITRADVQSKFQRYVAVRTVDSDDELRGKVLQVGDDAFILQTGNDTQVIPFKTVTSIIERRRRITVRSLRTISSDQTVRQHLADRHAIFISLLNAADEESCRTMHDRINHRDLGHHHVDPELAMAELDELHNEENMAP